MAKVSSKIPVDVDALARWVAQQPKERVKELEMFITRSSAAAFRRQADLLRIGLKWAWDEQPQLFFTLCGPWLKSNNARLRWTAAGALPLSHEDFAEKSTRQLRRLAGDKDRGVRLMAVDMLAEDINRNLDLAKRWSKDDDPAVRQIVARHLRRAKGDNVKASVPLLEILALDPEPDVHWAAGSTLLGLYAREPRPVLEITRQMANAEREEIRAASASVFFEHVFADKFDQLMPTIRSWLRAGDLHLRWTLVRSLRFIQVTNRSLQLLRALFEDKDPEIRRRVVQVLLNLYDPTSDFRGVVTDLLKRADQDSARRVREVVEEGRVRHGEDYLNPVAAVAEGQA